MFLSRVYYSSSTFQREITRVDMCDKQSASLHAPTWHKVIMKMVCWYYRLGRIYMSLPRRESMLFSSIIYEPQKSTSKPKKF